MTELPAPQMSDLAMGLPRNTNHIHLNSPQGSFCPSVPGTLPGAEQDFQTFHAALSRLVVAVFTATWTLGHRS